MKITAQQVRAAYEALGLDPDQTLSVSLSGRHAHIVTAALNEQGSPFLVGGVLQQEEHSIAVEHEEDQS